MLGGSLHRVITQYVHPSFSLVVVGSTGIRGFVGRGCESVASCGFYYNGVRALRDGLSRSFAPCLAVVW